MHRGLSLWYIHALVQELDEHYFSPVTRFLWLEEVILSASEGVNISWFEFEICSYSHIDEDELES